MEPSNGTVAGVPVKEHWLYEWTRPPHCLGNKHLSSHLISIRCQINPYQMTIFLQSTESTDFLMETKLATELIRAVVLYDEVVLTTVRDKT